MIPIFHKNQKYRPRPFGDDSPSDITIIPFRWLAHFLHKDGPFDTETFEISTMLAERKTGRVPRVWKKGDARDVTETYISRYPTCCPKWISTSTWRSTFEIFWIPFYISILFRLSSGLCLLMVKLAECWCWSDLKVRLWLWDAVHVESGIGDCHRRMIHVHRCSPTWEPQTTHWILSIS